MNFIKKKQEGFPESMVKLGTQICDVGLEKDRYLSCVVKLGTQM